MKNNTSFRNHSFGTSLLAVVLLSCGVLASGLRAGETTGKTTAPAEEEKDYTNWVNLTLGGVIENGNESQFHAMHGKPSTVFGGIEDSHYEKSFGKDGVLTIDGRAIFDNDDYKVKVQYTQRNIGYISAGYTGFRTFYNANGGYFPRTEFNPGGTYFGDIINNDLSVYRSSAWVELGLRMPDLPEVTFRYEHDTRYGQKDSTSWASTYMTGVATPLTSAANAKNIVPSFWNINEKRDIFTLNAAKTFGNTDLDLGVRYEHTSNDNSLNEHNRPGEAPAPTTQLGLNNQPVYYTANDSYITQQNISSWDIWGGHLSSVTRFHEKFWLTIGYACTGMNTDIGGSRIVGPQYDSPFVTFYNNQLYSSARSEFLKLTGGAEVIQNVGTISAMWTPIPTLTVTPSLRIEGMDNSSNSYFNRVADPGLTSQRLARPTRTRYTLTADPGMVGQPSWVASTDNYVKYDGSLDIRYTGINDILLYVKGDWMENDEDLTNNGRIFNIGTSSGMIPSASGTSAATVSHARAVTQQLYDSSSTYTTIKQKYSLGANWYPLSKLSLGVQYYHQITTIDQSFQYDNPNTAPIYSTVANNDRLVNQRWSTDDVNIRLTLRPISNFVLISRYDLQYTKIDSQWKSTTFPAEEFPMGQSGKLVNQMFTESLTWSPLDRLYFQANASYVLNSTNTPAAQLTPAVLNFTSNYWTVGGGIGFLIDNKTELRADYNYFRADNYINNAPEGVPYGSGSTEQTVTASISRQITRNVQAVLSYTYYNYRDQLYNGLNNYDAHLISSAVRIGF